MTPENHVVRSPWSVARSSLLVILPLLAYTLLFGALFKLDFPFILFVRSNDVPWLEQLGSLGNRLGDGLTLVLISCALLTIGWLWGHIPTRRAGFESLISHGLAGLFTQMLKRSLGRPRPRWTHADGWQLEEVGPSLVSGLDAFPSGHASASCAVAVILARHYPKGAWLWYAAAGWVAASRIIKGSHFPSDVLGGMLVGLFAGYLVIGPWRDWRQAAGRAGNGLLPWACALTGLLWLLVHVPDPGGIRSSWLWIGLGVVIAGEGLRASAILKGVPMGRRPTPQDENTGGTDRAPIRAQRGPHTCLPSHRQAGRGASTDGLVGDRPRIFKAGAHDRVRRAGAVVALTGVAITTGSVLIAIITVLATMTSWLKGCRVLPTGSLGHEGLVAAGLVAAVVMLRQVQGLVPLVPLMN